MSNYLNAMWISLEKLCKMGCYLILTVVVARVGGDSLLGNYFVILAVSVIFSAVSAAGLNSLLIKDFTSCNDTGQISSLLLHALLTRFSTAAIGGLCCGLLVSFGLGYSVVEGILTGLLVLLSSHQVLDFYLESRLQFKVILFYKSFAYAIGLGAKLFAVLSGVGVSTLLLAQLIEALFLSSAALWICRKALKLSIAADVSVKACFALLTRGLPLLLSSIAVIVYMKVDLPLIKLLDSASGAGQYSSASRLCEALFILSVPIIASIFPKMVALHESHDPRYFFYLRRSFAALLWLSVTLIALSWLLADITVGMLYGDDFDEAARILRVYAIALPFIYVGDLFSRWLIIKELLSLSIIRHCLGLTVNVGLNLLLIPTYGPVGAAVATVTGYLMATIIFILIHKKARKFIAELFVSRWENVS